MQPYDLKTLSDRLAELADVFERKAVTEKALRVWFDVLHEFPVERVAGVLIGWPKTHSKFPAPADVWKAVNEACIADRERKAAAEAIESKREFYPGVGGAKAEEFIAKIRKLLKGPTWSPMEHWRRVLDNPESCYRAKELAKEAILQLGAKSAEREPGQDDEERRAA